MYDFIPFLVYLKVPLAGPLPTHSIYGQESYGILTMGVMKKIIIMNTIIKIVKAFTPPILVSAIKKSSLIKSGWHGNFKTWEEAKSKTTGYDSALILETVRDSMYKVKEGLAVYERDSVLFDAIQYSWPLLTGLMMAAAKGKGKINVLDFGGSLGST